MSLVSHFAIRNLELAMPLFHSTLHNVGLSTTQMSQTPRLLDSVGQSGVVRGI
jgi:hypothetical protein